MRVVHTAIPEVLILEPRVFGDERGFFYESFNRRTFREATGLDVDFVQDNHSRSARGVLRGLHYQVEHPQGKLVRCVAGEVLDVGVDLRRASATFGKWISLRLSAENKRMAWIPGGFAHGFMVLSDFADFLYKTTDYYVPEDEKCIAWNDREIGIDWQMATPPILSAKDRAGVALRDAVVYEK
jgi:dTDP-4-dehydrorhamnose 3,5-epimerase